MKDELAKIGAAILIVLFMCLIVGIGLAFVSFCAWLPNPYGVVLFVLTAMVGLIYALIDLR